MLFVTSWDGKPSCAFLTRHEKGLIFKFKNNERRSAVPHFVIILGTVSEPYKMT